MARWLRYVRRHKIAHDSEWNRRCWCTGCKPYPGRNTFRVEYLKKLKRAKNVHKTAKT